MDINATNMDNLFMTFKTAFAKGMQSVAGAGPENQLKVGDVAMLMPVQGGSTQHTWLAQIKGMTEWIGTRLLKALKVNGLTVVNRKFEDTVTVPADNIKDDQYGQYTPLVAALGSTSDELWADLTGEALVGNAKWADDNYFFCSGRELGDSMITNAVTTVLSKTSLEAGMTAMRSFTLHAGRNAKVRPELLIVGPGLEATAKAIVEAELITGPLSNTSPAMSLKVKVCDDFVGDHATKWVLTGRKAGIPLVCVQQRELPSLTRMDKSDDTNVFLYDEYYYGTAARGEAFMTLPFLGYMGGMTSVPAWAEAA